MRVFFSFDYKGGNAYLGMKQPPLMMDVQVTDSGLLLEHNLFVNLGIVLILIHSVHDQFVKRTAGIFLD